MLTGQISNNSISAFFYMFSGRCLGAGGSIRRAYLPYPLPPGAYPTYYPLGEPALAKLINSRSIAVATQNAFSLSKTAIFIKIAPMSVPFSRGLQLPLPLAPASPLLLPPP